MAVLDALQSASLKLMGQKPAVFFTATGKFEKELVDLVNDAARDISNSHDWQNLARVYTITGNGSVTEFDLPPDYDRMLLTAEMQDPTNWFWGYYHIRDMNEWIWRSGSGFNPYPGGWIMFGNKFHFLPAPISGASAAFPYISNQRVTAADDTPKEKFTADDDSFVLPEDLLTLWLVWRWREQKRLDATNDQSNFVKKFSEYASKDGGARVIRGGSLRRPLNARMAWPFPLGPGY